MAMVKGVLSTVGELFRLLWQQKVWWLAPLVIVLLVFAALLIIGAATGAGPLVYTIF